jgi:hypothetical protein
MSMRDDDGEDNYVESHMDVEDDDEVEESVNENEFINRGDDIKVPFDENSVVHFLPAKISHYGKCRVDAFFTPLIETNDNISYKSQFRGRKLIGKVGNNSQTLSYVKFTNLNISGRKVFRVSKVNEIKKHFVWKFDQEVEPYNPIINVEKLSANLDILK